MNNDEDLMLLIPCSFCEEPPGSWCRTATGVLTVYLHGPRRNPIHEAWGRGYEECWKQYNDRRPA